MPDAVIVMIVAAFALAFLGYLCYLAGRFDQMFRGYWMDEKMESYYRLRRSEYKIENIEAKLRTMDRRMTAAGIGMLEERPAIAAPPEEPDEQPAEPDKGEAGAEAPEEPPEEPQEQEPSPGEEPPDHEEEAPSETADGGGDVEQEETPPDSG